MTKKKVFSFEADDLKLPRALELEWILANGLGGYASSTAAGLNTRKYHGLLVSSDSRLERSVLLNAVREYVESDGRTTLLSVNETPGGLEGGYNTLRKFFYDQNQAIFQHVSGGIRLVKNISVPYGRNAVKISYETENKGEKEATVVLKPFVSMRGIHELNTTDKTFCCNRLDDNTIKTSCSNNHITIHANSRWNATEDRETVSYRRERERGYCPAEMLFSPGFVKLNLEKGDKKRVIINAFGGAIGDVSLESSRRIAVEQRKIVGITGKQSSLLTPLFSAAESFIAARDGKKTVIAGYHWFGDWGRDAMISLPGLTLINGKHQTAESIMRLFLSKANGGRIPTRFHPNLAYEDFDGTLWLIDRVHQYAKYAGLSKTKIFLKEHWQTIKESIASYKLMEKDGLIQHNSGTWMDTLARNNAVEIQGLWYNALKVAEKLAVMVDGDLMLDDVIASCEKNILREYWNGRYLDDCLGDHTLRPNQVIVLSLDYCPVDRKKALEILSVVERELLTPFGLRTLCRSDLKYQPKYEGNVEQRDKAYHSGIVWPWLLGPYAKACVKYTGEKGAGRMRKILEEFFELAVVKAGLGTVSEVYDAEEPFKPGGCISQAWSVAEPLRAYFEDALNMRPPYETVLSELN